MRARELPGVVFRKILRSFHASERYDVRFENAAHDIAFFAGYRAVVSLAIEEREFGPVGALKVWEWDFTCPHEDSLQKFLSSDGYNRPVLQVIGGPRLVYQDPDERGLPIIELVTAEVFNPGHGFLVEGSFFGFLVYTQNLVRLFQCRFKPKPHRYWSRFVDKKANYLD